MCGIAGFSQNSNNSNKILRKMISSINHRGPDDNGLWVSNSEKVVLGHKPKVRGRAMNAVDHPHGGGEGKSTGGRPAVSPWGKLTKGKKTKK